MVATFPLPSNDQIDCILEERIHPVDSAHTRQDQDENDFKDKNGTRSPTQIREIRAALLLTLRRQRLRLRR
jgi:hypothetical protein